MRKLILSLIFLTVLCSISFAQSVPFPGPAGVGAAGGGGTTWLYPTVTTFPDSSGNIGTIVAVAAILAPGVSVTITKLGFYIADPQTATECSVGIYNHSSVSYKQVSCHFTPAANTWGECTVSYAVDSATTYDMWGQCNQDYKIRKSPTDCTAFYNASNAYITDLHSPFGESADTDCPGFRMGY